MIGTQKDLEPDLLMCYSGGKLPPFTRASEMQVDWNLLAKNDTSIINTLTYKMQEDSLVNCYDFFQFFWVQEHILKCFYDFELLQVLWVAAQAKWQGS